MHLICASLERYWPAFHVLALATLQLISLHSKTKRLDTLCALLHCLEVWRSEKSESSSIGGQGERKRLPATLRRRWITILDIRVSVTLVAIQPAKAVNNFAHWIELSAHLSREGLCSSTELSPKESILTGGQFLTERSPKESY